MSMLEFVTTRNIYEPVVQQSEPIPNSAEAEVSTSTNLGGAADDPIDPTADSESSLHSIVGALGEHLALDVDEGTGTRDFTPSFEKFELSKFDQSVQFRRRVLDKNGQDCGYSLSKRRTQVL
ncbi:hypothetical protein BV22DRAFT_1035570 [Leucogyrophana mollusca]|uniref:Uncharacterized protein n=1 Tax=Leucogyrophana mollusca TaxID=85980 RepID=A0ACB8BE12_9AGAM|nr:hypothetical protein BV22DRAFT_1035570 [Leucogyrophana mollusca]